jgi:hypothetical protein
MFGLVLEGLILLFVLLGLCMGRYKVMSSVLGYTSLGWFVRMLFVRYDHYGKVCSGEFLDASELASNSYQNLLKAAYFTELYFVAVSLVVSMLFLIVMVYSCCVESAKKGTEKEEEE